MSRSPRLVTLGYLAAFTAGAALLLTWFDARLGSSLWTDPESEPQWAASWRLGAVFAYTSGSVVGHICALVAGYLGARWWDPYDGLLLGLGIGAINLAASACMAVPASLNGETMKLYVDYVDPNPLRQPAVLGAMAAVLIMAVIMAGLGALTARLRRYRALLLCVLAGLVLVIHFAATYEILAGPSGLTLLGWNEATPPGEVWRPH